MTQIPLQSRFKQDIVRLRFGTGSYTRGEYVDGAVTATAYKASVQPFKDSGSEALQRLREGDRTKKLIVIYTYPGTLRTMSEKPNNTRADLVYYEGEVYEVQKTNIWKGQILSHDEVWAVEFDAGQLYPGEVPADTSNVSTNGTTINIYGLGNYLYGTVAGAFTFYVDGEEIAVTPVGITGSYLDTVRFTSDVTIYRDSVVTFDYDGTLTSLISGGTAAVTGGEVDNRSTQFVGYPLDDDGTVATSFGYGHLPTTAPLYTSYAFTSTGSQADGVIAVAPAPFTTDLIAATTGKVGVGFLLSGMDAVEDWEAALLLFQFSGTLQSQFTALARYNSGAYAYNFRSGAPLSTTLNYSGVLASPTGAKFGVLLDFDADTVSFYLNTVLIGVASQALLNAGWFPALYVKDTSGVGAGHDVSGSLVMDAVSLANYGFPAGTKNWNEEVI